jgi:hypothetical protein
MQEMMRGERNLPRGNRPLLLWERHANLLPLHLLNWFRLGLNSAFSADACAGGRSLVQRGSIYYFFVRDSWGRHSGKSISKGCWTDKHLAFLIRIIITPVLNGMPGRGGLTRGRSGTGVLGHLVFVIRIFRIRHGAIWSNDNPGII